MVAWWAKGSTMPATVVMMAPRPLSPEHFYHNAHVQQQHLPRLPAPMQAVPPPSNDEDEEEEDDASGSGTTTSSTAAVVLNPHELVPSDESDQGTPPLFPPHGIRHESSSSHHSSMYGTGLFTPSFPHDWHDDLEAGRDPVFLLHQHPGSTTTFAVAANKQQEEEEEAQTQQGESKADADAPPVVLVVAPVEGPRPAGCLDRRSTLGKLSLLLVCLAGVLLALIVYQLQINQELWPHWW